MCGGMNIRDSVKGAFRNALEKREKNRLERLALYFVSVLPPLKALTLAKRGEIRRPLRLLRFGYLGVSESRILKYRLADMVNFLDGMIPLPKCEPTVGLRPFNQKVLCVFHSCGAYDPSGYATRSVSLTSQLRALGIDVFSAVRPGYPWDLSKHRQKKKLELISYQGIEFKLFPYSPVTLHSPESEYIESYANQLCDYAIAKDVSIIHAASNYLNGSAAAIAGQKLGIPSIYELRGLWHITRAFSEPSYQESEHYLYVEKREVEACKAVDWVITLSGAMAEWLVERGVPANRIRVVGNATFSPKHVEKAQRNLLRERLDIPAYACVIGYLGSIVEYEGLDSLIQALARTEISDRPYLLIVGSGKYETTLKQMVLALALERHVVFAGRVAPEAVSGWYFAMDAIALPRKNHLLTRLVPAIKPFEVMAHHRPLLISRPLATALGDTLPNEGFMVVDFDQVSSLRALTDSLDLDNNKCSVPTWTDRAAEVIKVYQFASQV
jgi:glycosyltransferase involved in cell wall biosynthesis